ncbi:MAG: bifunctional transaldolase/phosoglucose isomerase [Candidatus Obscuribacter sp.]|nr:bifunctional transaldolase/phosoglucose isomerase [Candidatus Obscuribacter sp.]
MKTNELVPVTVQLSEDIKVSVQQILDQWTAEGTVAKVWQKDASVWTSKDESKWLDWLNLPAEQFAKAAEYQAFAKEIKEAGFTTVALLGMGGSSLAPEVFSVTYGAQNGYPQLHVLDSTDPQQIAALDAKLDIKKTLFVVSSKSGSTLEPNIFMRYFIERAKTVVGESFGSHFVAITDPGSKLEGEATSYKFRKIFHGYPAVGGRYSVLSPFGVVPLALLGVDLKTFLTHAQEMAASCKENDAAQNPGVRLGAIMGACAKVGRDKLTIFTSPSIYDFGAWLEQLVAESTGKIGKAIIPVYQESIGALDKYGKDRLFVYIKVDGDKTKPSDMACAKDDCAKIEKFLNEAQAAGHPVVTIALSDKLQMAGEFYRFEMATAVAGSVIGINPFDQPDVEASKVVTRDLTAAFEKEGKLPEEKAFFEEGQVQLYSDSNNAEVIMGSAKEKTLKGMLEAHLDRLSPGDYFALLAYLHMDHAKIEDTVYQLRMQVRDKKHVATCLGFGPRFLHSTGQAYKGGPGTGVFLQVTADDSKLLAVPDAKYSFGIVKAAQARGDFQVLIDRGRRALRLHITGDFYKGLEQFAKAMTEAIG